MFRMPNAVTITGRSSSITNSFVNAIIPIFPPTEEELAEALAILGMSSDTVACAYCGDTMSEWDHLRPLVKGKRPTGYVSEIANLVPACGKCNQSKGAAYWKDWMLGPARLSPTSRGIADVAERVSMLEAYEVWREPRLVDFAEIAGEELWERHWTNHARLMELMSECQRTAEQIRDVVRASEAPAQERAAALPSLAPLEAGRAMEVDSTATRMTKQAAVARAAARGEMVGPTMHFANVNAAKDVWWLDLPLSKTELDNGLVDLLLFDARSDELHHLRVPTSYFSENRHRLNVRADKGCIHLELKAREPGRFTNVVPADSGLDFGIFMV